MVAGAAASGFACPALAQSRAIRVGTTLGNSSFEKANGQGLFQGSAALFTAINKAGGINGSRVELVMADDTFKPEVAKANALAFEKYASVLAILPPLGMRQTAEVMDAVPGMAVVGSNTGTIALRKKNAPNTFRVRASHDQEIDKLVNTAFLLGKTRIGLVHSNDPLGQSVLAEFKTVLAKAKLESAVIATRPTPPAWMSAPAPKPSPRPSRRWCWWDCPARRRCS